MGAGLGICARTVDMFYLMVGLAKSVGGISPPRGEGSGGCGQAAPPQPPRPMGVRNRNPRNLLQRAGTPTGALTKWSATLAPATAAVVSSGGAITSQNGVMVYRSGEVPMALQHA